MFTRDELNRLISYHSEAFEYALRNFDVAMKRGSDASAARNLNEAATHAAILTELRAMLAAAMGGGK